MYGNISGRTNEVEKLRDDCILLLQLDEYCISGAIYHANCLRSNLAKNSKKNILSHDNI